MEEETRFCTFHRARHPISEFGKGGEPYSWCLKARLEAQQKAIAEQRAKEKDASYEKYCKICETKYVAKDFFRIDNSRPDGYSLYCRVCMRDYVKDTKTVPLTSLCMDFRNALLTTVLRSIKDQDRSIVRQLVEDFKHEGQPISFVGREWQIQILNDLSPNVCCRKRSQAGLTWAMEKQVMCLLLRYNEKPYIYVDHTGKERNRYLVGIYSFETKEKASNWSKIRLEKIKRDNPFIRDALKMGKTDQALLMQLGRTSLHLVGRSTTSGVTSIDADIVVIDEKDRDERPEIATQISARLLESEFMNTATTKGLSRTISSPEVSGAGISLQYENSNQYEWEIKCIKCGTWQVSSYPECIANFYEKGNENDNMQIPYWQCQNCHEPIDWTTIGKWTPSDPDYYENCRWIARKPENFNPETGKGIAGYQIPFMSVQRPAPFFLAERDAPEKDTAYLYNHLLGLPYDDVAKTLVRANFRLVSEPKWGYSGKGIYVMGCDSHPAQGGFITIWKQIPETRTATRPEGKWVVCYLEHVKDNSNLWDSMEDVDGKQEIKKGRLYELMIEFDINTCVVDVEPDTNEVEKLIKEFSFTKSVWSDKSGYFQDTFKFIEEEIVDNEIIPVCRILEDKVAAIDRYFSMIRFGNIAFLDTQADAPDRLMDTFFKSHMNLYKGEVETGKGGPGVKDSMAARNIREIYKKRIPKLGDHWVSSSKFCSQGVRIYIEANRTVRGVMPPSIHGMSRIPGT